MLAIDVCTERSVPPYLLILESLAAGIVEPVGIVKRSKPASSLEHKSSRFAVTLPVHDILRS